MIELPRLDRETGMPVEPPFYLLSDGSMINSVVFRGPGDYQYAVIGRDTFERCKHKIITREDIESRRLTAQLDPFSNAMGWHCQYVDRLWGVSRVRSFEDWYRNSEGFGFFSGPDVQSFLPETYKQFQGKLDELRKNEEEFYRRLESLRPVDTEPALF